MGKVIFWVSIFIGSLVLTRILARKAVQRTLNARTAQSPQKQNNALNAAEKMVRCEQCGLHLPLSEATLVEEHIWCSPAHAKLGAKQRV